MHNNLFAFIPTSIVSAENSLNFPFGERSAGLLRPLQETICSEGFSERISFIGTLLGASV